MALVNVFFDDEMRGGRICRVPSLLSIREKTPAPAGEYDLTINSVGEKLSKNGDPMLVVCFRIEGEPTFENIFTYFSFPNGKDAKMDELRLITLRRFLHHFDVKIDEEDGSFNFAGSGGETRNCRVTLVPFDKSEPDKLVDKISFPKFEDGNGTGA